MAARKKRQIKKTAENTEKESIEIVLSVPKGASVTSVSELPEVSPSSDITAQEKSSQIESTSNVQTEKTASDIPETSEDALPIEGQDTENVEEKVEELVNEEVSDDKENGKASLFKKIALWGGIAVIIGVLLGVALKLAYERGIAVGQEQMQAKLQSATPTPAVISTPTPGNITKTKYAIKVLNGSGVDGEATRVKGILEQAGYTVSSVGNADTSNIETTTIQTKSSVEQSWIDDLKVVLSKSFVVSYSKDLDDTAVTDVVVTVGSTKAQ